MTEPINPRLHKYASRPPSQSKGSQSIVFGILLLIVTATITAITLSNKTGWKVNVPLDSLMGGKALESDSVSTKLKVADGYSIELFSRELKGPRMLEFSPSGHLLVSQPGSGEVLIFHREKNGALNTTPVILLADLNRPHGLDIWGQWLYVAEMNRVIRIPFDDNNGSVADEIEVVVNELPSGGNHRSRTVIFGPDDKMYVSIGSSCNVCIESDPYRASIWRFNPDGSDGHLFASGLRNSVGLAWSSNGHLYATDNGRDLLGDELPACELNRIEAGAFYGWPFYYSVQGQNILDKDVKLANPIPIESKTPVFEFRAHNAPLGLHFIQSPGNPDQGALVVALHGSWNKSYKDGYKIVLLTEPSSSITENNSGMKEQDFVWGFLENDQVIGRPVDIAEDNNGVLYISDDYGGAIYRVSYLKPQ